MATAMAQGNMAQGKENSAPAPAAPPSSDLQKILAALEASKPQPPKPKTDMERILAALEQRNNNGGNRNNNRPGGNRDNRSRKPTLRHKYYCWSHGVNVSHGSDGCNGKKPGHNDAANYCNQLGGYQFGMERWCGLCPP